MKNGSNFSNHHALIRTLSFHIYLNKSQDARWMEDEWARWMDLSIAGLTYFFNLRGRALALFSSSMKISSKTCLYHFYLPRIWQLAGWFYFQVTFRFLLHRFIKKDSCTRVFQIALKDGDCWGNLIRNDFHHSTICIAKNCIL